MTRRHLVPCPECARHFRVNEAECPFCGAELPSSLRESVPPQAPSARLSRAALVAFGALGAGAFASASGCGGNATGFTEPAYGGAPLPDTGNETMDASTSFAPHYGLSPFFDAGVGMGDSSLDSGHAGAGDARASELGDATSEADVADAQAPDDSEAPDVRVVIAPPYGLAAISPQ